MQAQICPMEYGESCAKADAPAERSSRQAARDEFRLRGVRDWAGVGIAAGRPGGGNPPQRRPARTTPLDLAASPQRRYRPDAVLPGFEERVLKRAPEQTLRQLKQLVRRAQLRMDPASA